MKLLLIHARQETVDPIENLLASREFSIHHQTDLSSMVTRINRLQPDLLLINPNNMDWTLDTQQSLTKETPIPYILFSTNTDDSFISTCLNNGAADFLNFPMGPKEVLARIYKTIHSANYTRQSRILSFNSDQLKINRDTQVVLVNQTPITLTKTEFTILLSLASNPNRVFSRSDLMEDMRGLEFTGSDRAIDSHIKNLRLKIEKDSKNPEYILTVHGSGYRFGKT